MPVRLKRAGMRLGLHASRWWSTKRVGWSAPTTSIARNTLNTESAVVVDDPAFARALAGHPPRHGPGNAWTIGRRDRRRSCQASGSPSPGFERMPIFDLWPVKYATSYQFVPGPGCESAVAVRQGLPPLPPAGRRLPRGRPRPEVAGVRVFTAFGSGLSPILLSPCRAGRGCPGPIDAPARALGCRSHFSRARTPTMSITLNFELNDRDLRIPAAMDARAKSAEGKERGGHHQCDRTCSTMRRRCTSRTSSKAACCAWTT